MSRSGYTDDWEDPWSFIRYRGAVASALRGKRGRAFLTALATSLDALPQKRLISGDLERDGEVCALGALGRDRAIDLTTLDPEDSGRVAEVFGIADCLAREVVFENDEASYRETDEQRFTRMRAWVSRNLVSRPDGDSLPPDTTGR